MTADVDISLVSTLLNEESGLDGWFSAIAGQTLKPSELVIVDGGSKDGTLARLAELAAKVDFPVRVVSRPGVNIARGRNMAVELASHEWIAVVDGGGYVDHSWLEHLAAPVRREPAPDVVSGFFAPLETEGVQADIGDVITPILPEIDADTFLPSSRSILFRRESWKRAGGYPEWLDYCEDLVFDLAMRDLGSRFAFAPKALVRWDARPTLSAFAKQYYRYARGDGKSGLWPKRHVLRYLAYVGWTGLIAVGLAGGNWLALAIALLTWAAYLWKFARRVVTRRTGARLVRGLLMVPVVVTVGDCAKMAGYPIGVYWRLKRRG